MSWHLLPEKYCVEWNAFRKTLLQRENMSNQPKATSHGSLFYETSSGLSQSIRHADRDIRDVFCYFLCRRFELYIHHPKTIPSWSTCHVVFERRRLEVWIPRTNLKKLHSNHHGYTFFFSFFFLFVSICPSLVIPYGLPFLEDRGLNPTSCTLQYMKRRSQDPREGKLHFRSLSGALPNDLQPGSLWFY